MSATQRRRARLLGVTVAAMAILAPVGSLGFAHAAPGSQPGALPAAAAAPPQSDRTSAVEARRVDSVPTPRLGWYPCYGVGECATIRLPLDYDQPSGPTTEVALLRVKARDQAHKIGSLFVNPGGPGGSGTAMALLAPEIVGRQILERFDIVGIDPRGTNFSDNVRCFTSNAQQTEALSGLFAVPFPYTRAEERAAITSARKAGRACSSTGKPLSAAMSTAQVARDIDVIRRAVGDAKLSYFGVSYGSYLGNVYANMFPDRVRAVTIDGVLDPIAWTGTPATTSRPVADRLRSADGAYKALHEILVRCDQAGEEKCVFAAGDPVANYDLVAERLKAHPLSFEDPFTGQQVLIRYSDLVAMTLGGLYSPFGFEFITGILADLIVLTDPATSANTAAARTGRAAAVRSLATKLAEQEERAAQRPGWDFPYDNRFEAASSVLCTDGTNPANASAWPAAGAAADRRAKYFGRLWAWWSVSCASNTWTARDEDAYDGPFTKVTAAPVLVVGNFWDPATNYLGAVKAARLLPKSRLLSSDSWGHTAYGSSACVTDAVEGYLLTQALPPRGTVCRGDIQPFEEVPTAKRGTGPELRDLIPPVRPGAWG